jgi:NADH-quinone oxidoreductase subunit M
MVTLYIVTTLSLIGLPMLNSFVGEFLILSGSMQASSLFGYPVGWTVLATTGVILSAGYMLLMIQRVFYGHIGIVSEEYPPRDLNFREQIALWPMAALMLVMGVASPYWMNTLDQNAHALAMKPPAAAGQSNIVVELTGTHARPTPTFVDPDLKQAVDQKFDGKVPAAPTPEGRRY